MQKKAAWHRRAMSRVPWCSTFCACVWGCSHSTHRWSYTQVHTPLQCSCACECQCGGCALGRSSSGFAVLAVLRAFARLARAQSQLRAVFSFLDGYPASRGSDSTQGVRHPSSQLRHGPEHSRRDIHHCIGLHVPRGSLLVPSVARAPPRVFGEVRQKRARPELATSELLAAVGVRVRRSGRRHTQGSHMVCLPVEVRGVLPLQPPVREVDVLQVRQRHAAVFRVRVHRDHAPHEVTVVPGLCAECGT